MDSLMLDVEMQEGMLDHTLDQSLRDLEPQSQQVEPLVRAPKTKHKRKSAKHGIKMHKFGVKPAKRRKMQEVFGLNSSSSLVNIYI